jgi:hypothetical protein
MKSTFLALAMTVVAGITSLAPCASAAAGDNLTFNMVRAAGATCLSNKARGRVTISDLGPVQNMHVEVFGLTPNNDFTLFITEHSARPFGLSWYQGEITTDKKGNGVGDFTGIFSDETFVFDNVATGNTATQTSHVAMWFADPNDAANAGCLGITTPFDGDHAAGILVLSTENFPDAKGPVQRLGDSSEDDE